MNRLTGHPTVVISNGFKENNMPSSITFIGDLYKEAETLLVAKTYQDKENYCLLPEWMLLIMNGKKIEFRFGKNKSKD